MKNARIKCYECGKRRIARIIDQSRAGDYRAFCSRECSNAHGLREFAWRLNEGNVARHTLERLDSFIDCIVGKRLTYARLIAKVPA
jgi:endogenous inhibitor of DNA gyrase (YacG/DUF329 family)